MAIIATPQSAIPSWDETIVPALRKRLESESRTLTKRMSAVPMVMDDPPASIPAVPPSQNSSISTAFHGVTGRERSATAAASATAIPRPSLSKPRTSDAGPRPSYQDTVSPAARIMAAFNTDPPETKHSSATPSPPPIQPSRSKSFQRNRTRSQPSAVDPRVLASMNGNVSSHKAKNGSIHDDITNGTPTQHSSRPTSPYSKSTTLMSRIPKVAQSSARSGSYSSNGHSTLNGYTHTPPTPGVEPPSPISELYSVPEFSTNKSYVPPRRHHSPIQNEQPPFPPTPTSSHFHDTDGDGGGVGNSNARVSTDSEEHPFEHWYRGEVSRNGGVGELRVGKRMEMLEIANYGHTTNTPIGKRARPPPGSTFGSVGVNGSAVAKLRKRAGSLSGSGERDSFHMDGGKAGDRDAERVLDESPLTDLEDASLETHESTFYAEAFLRGTTDGMGEGSGGAAGRETPMLPPLPPSSDDHHYHHPQQHYYPSASTPSLHVQMRSVTPTGGSPQIQYARSATPTHNAGAPAAGGSVRSTAATRAGPPSRIPTARQGSEPPRTQTPTPSAVPVRAGSEPPPSFGGAMAGPSKPRRPSQGSTQSQQQQQQPAASSSSSSGASQPRSGGAAQAAASSSGSTSKRRALSPGANGSPSTPAASTSTSTSTPSPSISKKAKTTTAKPPPTSSSSKLSKARKGESKGGSTSSKDNRRSVAMYPAPQGAEGEELVDAIPTWTQPVGCDGNWDEVVLPVVARKKGLDGHYEKANGSPRHVKPAKSVVPPQPGTFGFDHSKYRPPPTNLDGDIPMDEFGQKEDQEEGPGRRVSPGGSNDTARRSGERPYPPAAVPERAAMDPEVGKGRRTSQQLQQQQQQHQQQRKEEDADGGAGCCKCVIM